jgi:hypothetical protein
LATTVVDVDTSIDVFTIGSVEDLAWEGVSSVGGDVVVGEEDDLVFRDAIALHDLVGMEHISLVTVVGVGV